MLRATMPTVNPLASLRAPCPPFRGPGKLPLRGCMAKREHFALQYKMARPERFELPTT